MILIRKAVLTLALASSLTGCETVGNVAQSVADSAKGNNKATEPAKSTATSTSASSTTAPPQSATSAAPACERNFSVTGSFFTGKQFKTNAPLPGVNPDAAYKKAFAEVAKRGWQIISSDKDVRMISASQSVSLSNSAKTVPFNVVIGEEKGGGANISFTFSIAGGLATSEDAVKTTFCDFTKSVGG
jgi:hypothetical protein